MAASEEEDNERQEAFFSVEEGAENERQESFSVEEAAERGERQEVFSVAQEDERLMCGVCLEEWREDMDMVLTGCEHLFCARCMGEVLDRGLETSRCPMCREALRRSDVKCAKTGENYFKATKRWAAASVSCVWRYGDDYSRREGGYDLLTKDSWLVVNVNYFHVGGTVEIPTKGRFVLAFRVKRLPDLDFKEHVSLFIDGHLQRRVLLSREIAKVGIWQLLILGTVENSESKKVSASMRAGKDEVESPELTRHPKSGLVIDCLVVFPPSTPPPSVVLEPDDNRLWLVTESEATKPYHIKLTRGTWLTPKVNARNASGHLRPTDPISFLWPDGTTQTLHAVIDDSRTLLWHTTHPDLPEVYWQWQRSHTHWKQPLPSDNQTITATNNSDHYCTLS